MSAALKLELFKEGELIKEFPLSEGEIWVGRDAACVIRLEDRAVSRHHAKFRLTEQGVEFENRSKFGHVRVDGKAIENKLLKNGDSVDIGSFQLKVVKLEEAIKEKEQTLIVEENLVEAIQSESIEAAPIDGSKEEPLEDLSGTQALDLNEVPAIEVPKTEPEANGIEFGEIEIDGATKLMNQTELETKPILEFGNINEGGTFYELSEDEVAIGRSQNCHVILEDKRSSRKHAVLIRKEGKYHLKDLGSVNGTLLNGERVDESELKSGDVIQIGDTKLTFKLVQADFEVKKAEFMQVPAEDAPSPDYASPEPMPMPMAEDNQNPISAFPYSAPLQNSEPTPDFSAPSEDKRSLIGKALDRYRAMNTRQQIVWGLVVLGLVWTFMEDEPEVTKVKLNMGQTSQKSPAKKEDKKVGMGNTFESLSPEQQAYVESQYTIAFDAYKNREYDTALLELGKIFSLVQNFKNAREIEVFAREGKRKLELQEEERKRRETEKAAQEKFQALLEQAGKFMSEGRYADAENLFPEIELIQPENLAVSNWRKTIQEAHERAEAQAQEKLKLEEIANKAKKDLEAALLLREEKKYLEALDSFDEIVVRPQIPTTLVKKINGYIAETESLIAAERDPLLEKGKELEQQGQFSEAYRSYQKAHSIDPTSGVARAGMDRIRGMLNDKAKIIYSEGVVAESFSDFEVAEKRYREVLEVVPSDDAYYDKAQSRLRKLTVLRKPATANEP